MTSMKPMQIVLAALFALAVAGCDTPPPPRTFPDVTYSHLPPILLDVGAIEISWAYAPPYKAPNADHLFPIPPGRAAERWAKDRLKAVGKGGYAKFVIRDASAIQERLGKTGGIAGVLTTDQSDRYVATLKVELVVRDDVGAKEGTVIGEASVSQTVAEDITLNDLEKVWFDMTERLMRDLNAQIESGARTYLKPFLK